MTHRKPTRLSVSSTRPLSVLYITHGSFTLLLSWYSSVSVPSNIYNLGSGAWSSATVSRLIKYVNNLMFHFKLKLQNYFSISLDVSWISNVCTLEKLHQTALKSSSDVSRDDVNHAYIVQWRDVTFSPSSPSNTAQNLLTIPWQMIVEDIVFIIISVYEWL